MGTKQPKKVLIMAGGTGGHVFPGLATADVCREHGMQVFWLGTKHGLEATLVPKAKIPLYTISISGLRGQGLKRLLLAPVMLFFSLLQSLWIMLKLRPNVVLGMGGYVAGPGGIAAWLLRRPLVIHEQNAVAGLTNKILSKFAKRVLLGFPNSISGHKKVFVTGNPLRKAFKDMQKIDVNDLDDMPILGERPLSEYPLHDKVNVLILGGSQGAFRLNEVLPNALGQFRLNVSVTHQTGKKQLEEVKRAYVAKGIDAEVTPFISDIANAYEWADIIISRAGALTVSEIMAAGVASVLIPYPHAKDNHQYLNAKRLEKRGAAIIIEEKALSPESLAKAIAPLIKSKTVLRTMGAKAQGLATPDADIVVMNECLKVVNG